MATVKKSTTGKTKAKKSVATASKKVDNSTEQNDTEQLLNINIDEAEKDFPKRHYVQIYKEAYPLDVLVGTIYWSDIAQDILIESLEGQHASQIENLMEGDLLLKDNTFVSRYETPKEWILNMANAIIGFNLYAKYFMETIDEAE